MKVSFSVNSSQLAFLSNALQMLFQTLLKLESNVIVLLDFMLMEKIVMPSLNVQPEHYLMLLKKYVFAKRKLQLL